MNKNFVYAGYVAVGALIVYLLIKNNKNKADKKDVKPMQPNTTPVPANVLKNDTGISFNTRDFIQPIRPKEMSEEEYYKKLYSQMSNDLLLKTADEKYCWSKVSRTIRRDVSLDAINAEVQKRGLNEQLMKMECHKN